METTVMYAFLGGLLVAGVICGFFGFAYGLQTGKRTVVEKRYFWLTRAEAINLVGHRMQAILTVARQRVPANWFRNGGSNVPGQFMSSGELREYTTLERHWNALRHPDVERALTGVVHPDLSIAIDAETPH
ncbi:hypothetical protein [Ottowia sp.]|uniref:hypothetical protein n=1 Tax=Ottowia sp. TaxID=1898956 RepID=UPI0025ED9330|nr:hypothetical protein [Ottowia sp.]MBK6616196.1 hypothetical protein [Ottowia sp.]